MAHSVDVVGFSDPVRGRLRAAGDTNDVSGAMSPWIRDLSHSASLPVREARPAFRAQYGERWIDHVIDK
jgi:hypothetical protein